MIDRFIEPILAPFRALRNAVFNIKQAPQTLKSQVTRAQGQVESIKADFKGYKDDVNQAKGMAQGGVQVVGSGAQKQAQGAPQAAPVPVAQPQAKPKMSLFGGKKCPSCGKKLHASWNECPHCGWGANAPAGGAPAAPAPSPGGKQRTMAVDLGAVGGGAVSDGMVGWFIPLDHGSQQGELFQLQGRVTIGSAADNDVVLRDAPSVSGHHCEIVASGGGFKLNDLGSTNGTFVNDKRVTQHDLIDNDNIRLGKSNFKFKSIV
jgi:hypothetical protein